MASLPSPLVVSPTTQRTVSPAETETSFSPGSRRDVGDLVDGGVELVEGAGGVGIDLDGIDVAVLGGLDAGGLVGPGDALLGRAFVLGFLTRFGHGLQLARQRQRLWHLHVLHGEVSGRARAWRP